MLGTFEAIFGFSVSRVHAQDSAPSVRRFARFAEHILPKKRYLPRQLSACGLIPPSEDLVFVELNQTSVVARRLVTFLELRGDLSIRWRKIVEFLQVFPGAFLVAQALGSQLKALS